jgi:phage major head subunit gpT-like protein
MALVSSGWQNELEPIMKVWFLDEYLRVPSKRPLIADMATSNKAKDTYMGIAGLGAFQRFQGTVPTTTPAEAYKVEVTHNAWAQSIEVSHDLYSDDQSGVIKQLTQGLAESANQTKEENFWDLFNHAFDTTYTGGDGLALCSTAHTTTVSSSTQSNSGTSALSHSALAAARLAMRKFTTWQLRKMTNIADMLIVPVDLEETAIVTTMSNLKSGTANNDMNAFQANGWKFKILVSEYLTDTNNWFVANTAYSKKHLHYTTREALKLFNDTASTTLVMKYAGYYRDSTAFSDWRWIHGSNVS